MSIFNFFRKQKIIEKRNNETNVFDYRLGDLVYLIEWKKYDEMVNGDFGALVEIYLFRLWVYNFTFRTTAFNIKHVVDDFLYEMINHSRTLGHPTFIKLYSMRHGNELENSSILEYAEGLNNLMHQRLNIYDEATKHPVSEKTKMEGPVIVFMGLIKDSLKSTDITLTDEIIQTITKMTLSDITKPVAELAIEAVKKIK